MVTAAASQSGGGGADDGERARALQAYVAKVKEHRECEAKVKKCTSVFLLLPSFLKTDVRLIVFSVSAVFTASSTFRFTGKHNTPSSRVIGVALH